MTYKTLKIDYENEIAILTLNRPEKRNAISAEVIKELGEALDEIDSNRARVGIMTGAGTTFSAGLDLNYLKEFPSQSPEQIAQDVRRIANLMRRIWSFPQPLVAAVNGPAIAGGTGIATLCDFTLAAPEARFGYTEVRIGFIPAIVSTFLVRQIGEKLARDLLLSGRLIGAEEARTMGLVNEVVSQQQLLPRAREVAADLASLSPTALAYTKRLVVKLAASEIDRELEAAVEMSTRARSTADFREGIAAFLEKRKPVWRGE
jgi:methylglutaconyl-CoA hydratase